MAALQLSLLTPVGAAYSGPALAVQARSPAGAFTVLAGHAPLVALLTPAVVRVQTETAMRFFAVTGGVIEVRPGSEVILLADSADPCPTAEAARARLRERLHPVDREVS